MPQQNAFMILGQFVRQAKRAGWPEAKRLAVLNEAKSGDYDHLVEVIAEALGELEAN